MTMRLKDWGVKSMIHRGESTRTWPMMKVMRTQMPMTRTAKPKDSRFVVGSKSPLRTGWVLARACSSAEKISSSRIGRSGSEAAASSASNARFRRRIFMARRVSSNASLTIDAAGTLSPIRNTASK